MSPGLQIAIDVSVTKPPYVPSGGATPTTGVLLETGDFLLLETGDIMLQE